MTAFELIAALQARDISFISFRNALKANELPVSTGWAATVKKLEPYVKDPAKKDEFLDTIQTIHDELTLYTDKAVVIYDLGKSLTADLLIALSTDFIDSESPYLESFPVPLSRDELLEAPLEVTCVDQWDFVGGSNFIFCSRQNLTERAELPAELMDEEARENYGSFDELIGIRRTPVQLFDSVSISKVHNTLEIRVDGIKKFNSDDVQKRLHRIRLVIQNKYKDVFSSKLQWPAPVNFYDALDRLYADKDGIVGELGHLTDASGMYHERMRHKTMDVRSDPYHNGGADAVKGLNIHQISKHWLSPSGYGHPEVSIPSNFIIASESEPAVNIIHVLNCASEDDYNFVLNKVL
ncbi:hypothetical protein N5C93_29655 [Pseudomonas nitroreducens]|uniref:Uncharacterized protein n=1 Tax=Pseudomonas nitroreducens TaxID=46680 RepID=A0ABS0KDY5_PSENT|nr:MULTISPECIES: hypothetical protein [Pseudomonas]MBG6286302.1 hypothetical protein [Pseudomonas nitroreducens]MDG9857938.1 hypothetical protein [Pseudomonas nitroreducens]MDH1077007.1 hypothetical protein [Pseudomonas nitroreducens]NNN25473.1 hypothetical protein [Pseudomonas nitroreducens]UCL90195.1 hypothetical protein LDJ84_30445 [Pseudomonas sp. HS-18]